MKKFINKYLALILVGIGAIAGTILAVIVNNVFLTSMGAFMVLCIIWLIVDKYENVSGDHIVPNTEPTKNEEEWSDVQVFDTNHPTKPFIY